METINNIKQQIQALEQSKGYHHQKYLNNLNVIDEKIDRVEKQMERTKSHVKRDLLKRHIDWYEDEITKMDTAIEIITNNIDSEIQRLNTAIKSVEEKYKNEKNSFEYNIQNIRKCCDNRSAASMFDALQSVANALEIIRAENRQT